MNLKEYENKLVNVILRTNELLIGILKKVPLLPLWRVGNRCFGKRRISKIYLAKK